jgi:hypothetical protein
MSNYIRILIFLAICILSSFLSRDYLLSGAQEINLARAESLDGVASQSLANSAISSSALPAINKDFEVKEVRYFNNQDWVALKIGSLQVEADPAILILKKQSGMYMPVLGPGTAFSENDTQNLPPDVAEYLITEGAVYGP